MESTYRYLEKIKREKQIKISTCILVLIIVSHVHTRWNSVRTLYEHVGDSQVSS